MRDLFASAICTLALAVLPVRAANDAPDPAEIDKLFSDIDAAFAARDAEAVLSRFSDHYLADAPPMTKGQLRESLKTLCAADGALSSHHELRDRLVCGDRALVVARHTLTVGDDVDVSDVQYRLSAASGAWRIVSRTVLPENATPPAPGEPFEVKSFGLRVKTPENWHLYLAKLPPVAGDDRAGLRMESPDLGASMSVCVLSMPMPIAPKDLAALCERQVSSLVPDSKFDAPCVEKKDGAYEIRIDWKQPNSDFADCSRIVMRQQNSRLVVAELVVHEKGANDRYQPAFDSLLKSLTLTEPPSLPPDQGRLEQTTYVNDVYGCRVKFPPDWSLKQVRAFSFCTVGESPDGSAMVTFAGCRLPRTFSASQLLDADEAMFAEMDETYKPIERSATSIGDREWETSLSTTSAGGPVRKRLRMYTVRGDVLYFFVCDAIPPETFDTHRKTFKATVKTLELKDTHIEEPVVDQSMLANPKSRCGTKGE